MNRFSSFALRTIIRPPPSPFKPKSYPIQDEPEMAVRFQCNMSLKFREWKSMMRHDNPHAEHRSIDTDRDAGVREWESARWPLCRRTSGGVQTDPAGPGSAAV